MAVVEETHAILSPSSADRWMLCPGSVPYNLVRTKSSAAADEGTAAHKLAELALTNETDPIVYEGEEYKGVVFSEEMVGEVRKYTEFVSRLAETTGGDILIEQKLDISGITGEVGAKGTADAVILTSEELIVIDLKYGRGVEVAAVDNRQLRIYALAALEEYRIHVTQVRLIIFQPRMNNYPEWVVPIDDLLQFGAEVAAAAAHTRAANPPRIPGEKQCKWCNGKATCPELEAYVDEALTIPPNAEAIRLADALRKVDLAVEWGKAVWAYASNFAETGDIPGRKLVLGKQGNRAWSDEGLAEEVMKSMKLKMDEMYTKKVISPTVAEKLLADSPKRWSRISALITRPDAKPTLVLDSDKRPAIARKDALEFDDETDVMG